MVKIQAYLKLRIILMFWIDSNFEVLYYIYLMNYSDLCLTRMTSLNKINTDGQNYYISVRFKDSEIQSLLT